MSASLDLGWECPKIMSNSEKDQTSIGSLNLKLSFFSRSLPNSNQASIDEPPHPDLDNRGLCFRKWHDLLRIHSDDIHNFEALTKSTRCGLWWRVQFIVESSTRPTYKVSSFPGSNILKKSFEWWRYNQSRCMNVTKISMRASMHNSRIEIIRLRSRSMNVSLLQLNNDHRNLPESSKEDDLIGWKEGNSPLRW